MTRKYLVHLAPALVLALGILAATFVASSGSGSLWLLGAGVLWAAVSIVAADILGARLRGEPLLPSVNGIFAVVALLMACGIVALRDPELVPMLIPIVGGGSTTILLSNGQRGACARRSR